VTVKIGFWDPWLQVWKGGRAPLTEEDKAEIDRRAAVTAAAQIAAMNEAARPFEQRVNNLVAEILKTMPADVLQDVRDAMAGVATAREKFTKAQGELRELLENEPTDDSSVEYWAERKVRMETALPLYAKFAKAADVKMTEACERLRKVAQTAGQPLVDSAYAQLAETQKRHLAELEEVRQFILAARSARDRASAWRGE
jgi:hypothetical protein